MYFVMLRGVPYETEKKLTERERRAIQHGPGRSTAAFLIVFGAAFTTLIIVSQITKETVVMSLAFIAVSLIGGGPYLWISYNHNQIINKLRATGVLIQGEHAEKHYLFVRAIRTEIIRRDLNETTDEQIAEMMNRNLIYVDTVERLDQAAPDFSHKLAVNASNIIDAEVDRREAR